jgi:hypothetical protein
MANVDPLGISVSIVQAQTDNGRTYQGNPNNPGGGQNTPFTRDPNTKDQSKLLEMLGKLRGLKCK